MGFLDRLREGLSRTKQQIVSRFEDVGLTIERMELGVVTPEQAAANYVEHEGKPFYETLVGYITSGPVVKMVVSGPNAVSVCRKLIGATNPAEAAPAEAGIADTRGQGARRYHPFVGPSG